VEPQRKPAAGKRSRKRKDENQDLQSEKNEKTEEGNK